jgi:hypothetical protein
MVMALQIQLYSDNYFTFSVTLEKSLYAFTFRYNETDLAWYLDIVGITDTSIVIRGIRIVCNINLLEQYRISTLGGLYVSDILNQKAEPTTREDFDSWFVMYYEPI